MKPRQPCERRFPGLLREERHHIVLFFFLNSFMTLKVTFICSSKNTFSSIGSMIKRLASTDVEYDFLVFHRKLVLLDWSEVFCFQ